MDPNQTRTLPGIADLWQQAVSLPLEGRQVDLLLYRSNLLGSDLRLTNYGGGNTSCKTREIDPVSGVELDILWVKGSGGDLGTLERKGLSALDLGRLRALKRVYKGLEDEDRMVGLYAHCLFDPGSRPPSIDTPLHALLPFPHIDHLHPDAIIALAACMDGPRLCREVFGGGLAFVEWQRPGFDLALKLEKTLEQDPKIRGIILGGHGLFSWGASARDCYLNTLDIVRQAEDFLERNYKKNPPVFGISRTGSREATWRHQTARDLFPYLRGAVSGSRPLIGHYVDTPEVMEFVNSESLGRLADLGTSCPDHFLRTKIRPLVLRLGEDLNPEDPGSLRQAWTGAFEQYREQYQAYYLRNCRPDSPPMRNPNPVILLCQGIGLFAFGKDKQDARIAAEFYIHAIQVMKGAQAVSSYIGLSESEAFRIEYWSLEEVKLRRMPAPKPLEGRVALITGASGGIGSAIARKLAREGACLGLADFHPGSLEELSLSLQGTWGRERILSLPMDITRPEQIRESLDHLVAEFGGLDILVHSAGLSISKPIEATTDQDWDLLQDVLVKGAFRLSRAAAPIFKRQGLGGDIVQIVSKNALVAGPDNLAYSTAKAAQLHMSRLLAAELGPDHIRVNTVNPDAVIHGSRIWQGAWAEGRARAYGIEVQDLPAYYAKRTLLNETIEPEDIADAVFAFLSGLLNKSTGNILNVDGGIPAAFVR